MKYYLLLSIFWSIPSFCQADGGNHERWCQDITSSATQRESNQPKAEVKKSKKNAFRFLLNWYISPRNFASIEKSSLEDERLSSSNSSQNKIAFSFLPEQSLSKEEEKEIKATKRKLSELKKRIKKSNFIKDSKNLRSVNQCLDYLEKNRDIGALLNEMENFAESSLPILEKDKYALTTKKVRAQLSAFEKKGWTVFYNPRLTQIHSYIQKTQNATVLFVAHASEDGMLFTPEHGSLPHTFFANLSQVDNFIIYSCFSKAVFNLYRFPKASSVFQPVVRPYARDFIPAKKIPLQSLKSVLKMKFLERTQKTSSEQCFVESTVTNKKMGVFINSIYVGGLEDKVYFDCDFLNESNEVEIYSLEGEFKSSLDLYHLNLNGETKIDLDEKMSKYTKAHLVTKGTF